MITVGSLAVDLPVSSRLLQLAERLQDPGWIRSTLTERYPSSAISDVPDDVIARHLDSYSWLIVYGPTHKPCAPTAEHPCCNGQIVVLGDDGLPSWSDCQAHAEWRLARRVAGSVGSRFATARIQNLPWKGEARKTCLRFAATIRAGDFARANGLYIYGGPGSYKTFLAAALLSEAFASGIPAEFLSVPALLDGLRDAVRMLDRDPEGEARGAIIRKALTTFAVLDDLGAHRWSPYGTEQLLQILDHRYRQNLPTVITSNLSPDQLERAIHREKGCESYAARIVSRLCELTPNIIRLSGADVRRRSQRQIEEPAGRGDARSDNHLNATSLSP